MLNHSKQSENSCVWTFGWDLTETFSKNLGGELHSTCKGSQYVWKKKCIPRLIKVEKMTSSLKTLQDELWEFIQKKTVRIKRRLFKDMSVTPSFEAGRNYFKSPMQSLNKTLFPSNTRENPKRFPPAVQIIGYQTARPSIPGVVRTFPQLCKHMTP